MRLHRRDFMLASAAAALSGHASANAWPSKPLRIIAPAGPGSPADTAIRAFQDLLPARLGQPMVIENRPGAQGVIGLDAVAKSPVDNHTFGMMHLQLAAAPAMRNGKMPFDLEKDIEPVVQLSTESPVLLVNTNLPANTLKEFIELAKSKPQMLVYGSAGSGSPAHLGMELLQRAAGMSLVHVPYKTIASAVTDLAGKQIDVALAGSNAALQGLNSGRVRALAVSAPQRLPAFPNVPTLAEAGFPGIDLRGWVGLVARSGTDAAAITRLNAEVNELLKQPKIRERFAATGSEPAGGSPALFKSHIQRETARWQKLVVEAKISAD